MRSRDISSEIPPLRSTVACGLRSKDLHLAKPRLRSAISSLCSLWPEPLGIRVRGKSGFIVATSTELPLESDEKSTEPWDVLGWRVIKIRTLVNNLNLIIHMSSQT